MSLDFNVNLNPNNIDLSKYNCDKKAMENLELSKHIKMKQYGSFPEGFDIEVGMIKDVNIEGTGYSSSACKIYYPKGTGPFPTLFFVHGGAYYGGWQFLDEPLCRQICNECNIAVVSPNYVLAPDFKFPLPVIELYKDILYLMKHQKELELDMNNLFIGGGSAGGHHALDLCQIAFDRYNQDKIKFRYGIFFYPSLDCFSSGESRIDIHTDSSITPEAVDLFISLYCNENDDRRNPLISPINMNLSALPKSVFFSGRKDILNKSFREFSNRVMEEGLNEVLFKTYPNAPHGFLECDCDIEAARDSKALVCDLLKRELANS